MKDDRASREALRKAVLRSLREAEQVRESASPSSKLSLAAAFRIPYGLGATLTLVAAFAAHSPTTHVEKTMRHQRPEVVIHTTQINRHNQMV